LLLQGPVGGFFAYLAKDLKARGHSVAKFNFNAGDLVFSRQFRSINYTHGQNAWRKWLREYCENWRPDAILLFGDQRPIHRIAMQIAREKEIAVYCFEEGYIRPNYVTFERGGNNANSPLLRGNAAFIRAPEPPPPQQLTPQFGSMARRAMLYYIAKAGGTWLFPGYLHHRRRTLMSEAYLWTLSYIRLLWNQHRDNELIERLTAADKQPFFLVALQVHDDLQLLRHGKGWRNRSLIKAAIASFAQKAAKDDILIFKVHPMDRGHRRYRLHVSKEAKRHGVADRVKVLQSGPLAGIVRQAKGLITINSSSGIVALEAGVPVLALGKAIYGMKELVCGDAGRADLDAFWASPRPARRELAKGVVRILKRDHMIPGSFYLPQTWRGMAGTIDGALRADAAREAENRSIAAARQAELQAREAAREAEQRLRETARPERESQRQLRLVKR
jgi:capsular polysaccharide export protein